LARYTLATVSPVLSSGRNRCADGAAGGEWNLRPVGRIVCDPWLRY